MIMGFVVNDYGFSKYIFGPYLTMHVFVQPIFVLKGNSSIHLSIACAIC